MIQLTDNVSFSGEDCSGTKSLCAFRLQKSPFQAVATCWFCILCTTFLIHTGGNCIIGQQHLNPQIWMWNSYLLSHFWPQVGSFQRPQKSLKWLKNPHRLREALGNLCICGRNANAEETKHEGKKLQLAMCYNVRMSQNFG